MHPHAPRPYGELLEGPNGRCFGGAYVALPLRQTIGADAEEWWKYTPGESPFYLQLWKAIARATSKTGLDLVAGGTSVRPGDPRMGNAATPSHVKFGELSASVYEKSHWPVPVELLAHDTYAIGFVDTSGSDNTITGMIEGREIWSQPPPFADRILNGHRRSRAFEPWTERATTVLASGGQDAVEFRCPPEFGVFIQAVAVRGSVDAQDVRLLAITSREGMERQHVRGVTVDSVPQKDRLYGDVWGCGAAGPSRGKINHLPVEIPVLPNDRLAITVQNDNGSNQHVDVTVWGQLMVPR